MDGARGSLTLVLVNGEATVEMPPYLPLGRWEENSLKRALVQKYVDIDGYVGKIEGLNRREKSYG